MIPAVSAAKGALYRKTMSGGRPESKERFIMDRKRRSGSERTTKLREKNVARIEERCRPQEVDRTISPVSWLHHIAERFTSPRVRYPLVPQKRSRPLRKGGTLMVLLMLLLVTSKQLRS
jgi:hypothetical protein